MENLFFVNNNITLPYVFDYHVISLLRQGLSYRKEPYTEPHHPIPISNCKDFDYAVDVVANIVSLCSHFHNLLHYGRFEDKKTILDKLYNDRKDTLMACGLELSLVKPESYYKP